MTGMTFGSPHRCSAALFPATHLGILCAPLLYHRHSPGAARASRYAATSHLQTELPICDWRDIRTAVAPHSCWWQTSVSDYPTGVHSGQYRTSLWCASLRCCTTTRALLRHGRHRAATPATYRGAGRTRCALANIAHARALPSFCCAARGTPAWRAGGVTIWRLGLRFSAPTLFVPSPGGIFRFVLGQRGILWQ